MSIYICIYIYIYIIHVIARERDRFIYISIYIDRTRRQQMAGRRPMRPCAPNLRTWNLGFARFDSSKVLTTKGGILPGHGDSPGVVRFGNPDCADSRCGLAVHGSRIREGTGPGPGQLRRPEGRRRKQSPGRKGPNLSAEIARSIRALTLPQGGRNL